MWVLILRTALCFHGGVAVVIFEERYQVMLEKALEGVVCLRWRVVKVRMRRRWDGGVRASMERGDGTPQALLHGVIRVRFQNDSWRIEVFPMAMIEAFVW
jgi:hypothetical protein